MFHKIPYAVLALSSLIFSTRVCAIEETYNATKAKRICGSITKQMTRDDGIKNVFQEDDGKGQILGVYILDGKKPQAVEALDAIALNTTVSVCVTGVQTDRLSIDAPPKFFTFKIE